VRIVFPDHVDTIDFVVPTLGEARDYIRDGALNGVELLEDAGMTPGEAEAEAARLRRR
jgi:hypothetical protein